MLPLGCVLLAVFKVVLNLSKADGFLVKRALPAQDSYEPSLLLLNNKKYKNVDEFKPFALQSDASQTKSTQNVGTNGYDRTPDEPLKLTADILLFDWESPFKDIEDLPLLIDKQNKDSITKGVTVNKPIVFNKNEYKKADDVNSWERPVKAHELALKMIKEDHAAKLLVLPIDNLDSFAAPTETERFGEVGAFILQSALRDIQGKSNKKHVKKHNNKKSEDHYDESAAEHKRKQVKKHNKKKTQDYYDKSAEEHKRKHSKKKSEDYYDESAEEHKRKQVKKHNKKKTQDYYDKTEEHKRKQVKKHNKKKSEDYYDESAHVHSLGFTMKGKNRHIIKKLSQGSRMNNEPQKVFTSETNDLTDAAEEVNEVGSSFFNGIFQSK